MNTPSKVLMLVLPCSRSMMGAWMAMMQVIAEYQRVWLPCFDELTWDQLPGLQILARSQLVWPMLLNTKLLLENRENDTELKGGIYSKGRDSADQQSLTDPVIKHSKWRWLFTSNEAGTNTQCNSIWRCMTQWLAGSTQGHPTASLIKICPVGYLQAW